MPVRGSVPRLAAGKTYCHFQSRSALGIFAGESVRQVDVAEAFRQVLFVDRADVDQVVLEAFAGGFREHGHPVAAALGSADGDVAEVEVDVLDAKAQALEDPHAGAVEQQHDELRDAFESGEDGRHFFAAEDVGQAARLAGAHHVVEPLEVGLEDVAVEEENGGQGLALGRDRDPVVLGEVGQKPVEIAAVEIARVAAVKLDVAADPACVGLFGSDRVVADADFGNDPVHEAPGARRGGRGKRLNASHGGVNGA